MNSKTYQVNEVKMVYKTFLDYDLKVSKAQDVVDFLRKIYDPDTFEYNESFIILLLNKGNRLIGFYHLSEGGTTGTVIDIKHILQAVILANANAVILSHNHPSGNRYPSEADKRITEKIKNALVIIDSVLLDHIILTSNSYYSFGDEGILI